MYKFLVVIWFLGKFILLADGKDIVIKRVSPYLKEEHLLMKEQRSELLIKLSFEGVIFFSEKNRIQNKMEIYCVNSYENSNSGEEENFIKIYSEPKLVFANFTSCHLFIRDLLQFESNKISVSFGSNYQVIYWKII